MGQPYDLFVQQLEFMPLTKEEIEGEIARIEQTPKLGEAINPGHVLLGKLNPQNNQMYRAQVSKDGLIQEAQNPNQRQGHYANFLGIYTVRLDGTNRLSMLNEQDGGDLQTTPNNHLAHLFLANELSNPLRFSVLSRE
jgi:hypothetical protein